MKNGLSILIVGVIIGGISLLCMNGGDIGGAFMGILGVFLGAAMVIGGVAYMVLTIGRDDEPTMKAPESEDTRGQR